MASVPIGMRIGELAQRVGLSRHTLRAWEKRYGVLQPTRTAGGYRLYGLEDERRIRDMLQRMANGASTASAASAVLQHPARTQPAPGSLTPPSRSLVKFPEPGDFARAVFAAVAVFDEQAVEDAVDTVLDTMSLGAAIDVELLPLLKDLGARWETGEFDIAHEHFLSGVLRRRISARIDALGNKGPHCLLAAPAQEQHDLPLLMFAAILAQHGFRVRYLGANTPVTALDLAARTTDLVILAATTERHFLRHADELRKLAERCPVVIAGSGASERVGKKIGVSRLSSSQREALSQIEELNGLGDGPASARHDRSANATTMQRAPARR